MAIKKSQLYNMLWESCNALRGTMDATQYKDYVLVMLFWKYISDKADAGTSDIEIPEGCHFNDICAHKTSDCAEYTNTHLKMLAEANGLQDDIKVNFLSKERMGDDLNKRVGELIGVFEDSKLNFSSNREGDDDLIGDAYEFLMRKFAADSGKSKGQFYTPGEVSRLMAKLVGIDRDVRTRLDIYDPTCGSGSLLLRAKAEFCGDPDSIHLYGQESDSATKGMACMNFIVHGYTDSMPLHGDTIDKPLHLNGSALRQFDYVVANPPFSQTNWIGSNTKDNDTYDRWGDIFDPATGRLIEHIPMPPAGCGDYAFLLHIVKSMKSDGKAAVILPHGVLFRGKEEAAVREYLISKKIIRGIIGLPGNLFYGTGIPACILILNKTNAIQSKGIFMINAKDGFTKDGAKNRLREQDIRRIIDVWRAHEDGYLNDEPHYAHFATYKEIIEDNKCNLNVNRYVKSKDKEIKQDINAHINLAGGLPVADVDEGMADYWVVCTTLKPLLYAPYGVEGYYKLAPTREEIADVISNDQSYQHQENMFRESVLLWSNAVMPSMKKLKVNCKPRLLITEWNSKLLQIGKEDKSLVNAYELYDQLMGYWHDELQDDCYLIADNGWKVSKPEAPQIRKKDKKSKTYKYEPKTNYNYDEMVCDLLPVSVVIEEYFKEDDLLIKSLDAEAAECAEKLKALVDEDYPQLFESRYFWNSDPTKSLVEKRAKYARARKPMEGELEVLEGYLPLMALKGKGVAAQQTAYRDEHPEIFAEFDKFNKTTINGRILEIQNYEQFPQSVIKVWEEYVALEVKKAALNAQSKELKKKIKEDIIKKYKDLKADEVKHLVVECKWMKRMHTRFDVEMERVKQQFTNDIITLQDRYARTLPELEQALEDKRKSVINHLMKMGFNVEKLCKK